MEKNEALGKIRQAYERGRMKRAFARGLLVAGMVLPLVLLGPYLSLGAALAAVLLLGSFFSLWRGLDWERGWVRGLMAGLLPLGFALIARPFGHGCQIGGQCYSWCMPACAAGGFAAAIVVARWAARSERPATFALSSGIATLATGALGCSCVSLSGALALVAVYVVGSVPAVIVATRAHAA